MNRKTCNAPDAIEDVLAGNSDAFGDLVRRYQGMVVGLAFHYVGNLHDAEDIGQEVFIQAYRRLSQLKRRDKFASWLRRITENRCKTWLRLNQKERHMLELDETLVHPAQKPPDAILLDEALSETVQHAIAQLSEPNRLAVTLFYMHGASYKELSEFLDIGISAVKGRLHKARQQLKKGLWTMVENDVSKKRPKEAFTQRVMDAIVVGRVITLNGKPIHGASIEFRAHDAGAHGRESQERVLHTDADGRYRYPISAPEQSLYSIRAKHPDFEESQESKFVVEVTGELGMTDLVLKPPPVSTVRGKVTDESGNPIEGAFLCSIFHRPEKGDENTAATNAAGEYSIDRWVIDRPLLYAKADGYTAGVAHLDLTNRNTFSIDFVLKPAVETSGRVVDENGEPVEQTYVEFRYPRQRHGTFGPWSTYTDADGRFCISGLPEGTMRVKARHDDYHDTDDWQEITSGDTDVELILTPITLAKILGQVVDAETGNPISDFTYFTDRPYEPSEDRESVWKGLEADGRNVTSKFGEFTTKALDIDCELDVIVTADGYAPFRICNVVVGCERLRFPLEPGKTVQGRVVDAKTMQPIANASVRHFCAECPLVDMRDVEGLIWYGPSHASYRKQGGQSSATDAAGRFVLDAVGRMGGYLYIEPPDGSQHAPSVVGPIEFDDGASEIEMVIMCNPGGAIQGNVPELPADEIAHYRDYHNREGTPIETVWIVSDEIPYLKIERGQLIKSGEGLNLEEMECDDPIEIPDSRDVAIPHIMPGRWRLEHCTHHPDFADNTEVVKAISLQIEKEEETITEPLKTMSHDGDREPEIQPERLDFGTVCSDSVVEAHIVLHGGLSISSSTLPKWVRFDTAWIDSWGRWRIDITADTSTIGSHEGIIRIQTDTGEFTLPTSISVIERGSPSQKILWADTPFDGFSGMSTALLDELIRSHHLDIDFTREIPCNLDLYEIIVLAGDAVCNIWREDVMRLQNFVEAGGRLVVGADAFYRTSVEGLNKIVHTYGFKMLDIEPNCEVDVEIHSVQLQTDWQRNLFAGVDRLHFFRPSPIVVDNRDAFCIRHPDDRNLVYVSGVKVNSGEVFVIGQSLLLKFFSEAAGNQGLLANLLTTPANG